MAERLKFDEIVLKVALERDLTFITEAVLDRAVITSQLLNQLLREEQQNMIVELMFRSRRPLFISDQLIMGGVAALKPRESREGRPDFGLTKKLQFPDIIESMINLGRFKSAEIIDMMRLMQQRVEQAKPRRVSIHNDDDPEKLLDYEDLFKLFIVKRKVKLLRFLFSLSRDIFDFHADLFLKALELEAYDMAALLFKEFFRQLRNMEPQQLEFAISHIVSSYNRANGMIDFKAYLVRQFTEQMQLRHARTLLDAIRNKVKTVSKQNILVMNLNVLKTACLLIENLAEIGLKFNLLQVRCTNLRNDIIQVTRDYMARVESEYEMKYLLLEKDFEHRDSLDHITKHNIVEFLET